MEGDVEILDSRSEDSVRRHIIMVNRVVPDVLLFFFSYSLTEQHH